MSKAIRRLESIARLLVRRGRNEWGDMLHGGRIPAHDTKRLRMERYQPGDWVYEQSSSYMFPPRFKDFPAINKVGIFLRESHEPIPNWEEGETNPGECCLYIKLIDGREFRWTNARFVAFAWEDDDKAEIVEAIEWATL